MPQQLQQTKQVNTSRADTLTAELLPLTAKITVTLTKQHSGHLTQHGEQRTVWGAVRKNIISDRFSTKTAIAISACI